MVVDVDPKGTSQHCYNCLDKVAKTLAERWYSCVCGFVLSGVEGEELDRDYNSAKLIKKIGLEMPCQGISTNSGGGTPSLKKAFVKKEKESRVVTVLRSKSG